MKDLISKVTQAIRHELKQSNSVQQKYTDINGIAKILGMKRTTARIVVKQWVNEGRVKPRIPQKKRLYSIEEIVDAMEATAA